VERLAGRATLLTIAHRLHSVRNAHRILVLDQGCPVQLGTHSELLEQPGRYRELVGRNGRRP
jgi:ABC-type multidrug transport system fused ATPase/permease subunit